MFPKLNFKIMSKLIGNQKRIDLNKNGKIDAEDFKLLRSSMNGAYRNEKKHVNHNEDYEVRYARNKPARTGYKGKRNFAEGGEVESAIKGYKEYTENLWKGDGYFSEKNAKSELSVFELDLRKLNDGKLAPSKVVGGGYKNARKVAQEWLAEQIKKQKSIIETKGLSNKTNHSNFRHLLKTAERENIISEKRFNELFDESNDIMDSLGETYAFGGSMSKSYSTHTSSHINKGNFNRSLANKYAFGGIFGGRTYSTGRAYTNDKRHVNHSEEHEVQYIKKHPNQKRHGYGNLRFAEGGGLDKNFKIGDKVKIKYISDNSKHNNKIGTITWLNEYNYYPNKDYSVVKKKTQAIITYEDGSEEEVSDLYAKGSGVTSPAKKVSFAEGGSLENHGLKKGDRIIKTIDGGIQQVKDKDGNIIYVNLANGERSADVPLPFNDGGEVTYFVNKDGIRVRSKVEPKEKLSEKEWMAKHSESKEARAYAGGGLITEQKLKEEEWFSPDGKIQFEYIQGRLRVTLYYGKNRRYSTRRTINNASELSLKELNEQVKKEISYLKEFAERDLKRTYAGGGDVKMVDGVMFEKVKFSNGIEDWYFSSDLHKVNFYCEEHGLNPKNQKDFEKAFSELRKQNKVSYNMGGKVTFAEKSRAIAKNFVGKRVEPKYQKEYGKTYDAKEAKEVGNKIAGAQKAKYDGKMAKGGEVQYTDGYFEDNSEYTSYPYTKIINDYFNKWDSIKTEKDSENFKKLNPPMFGTYKNKDILEQISIFENLNIPFEANEVKRRDFKKEVSKIISTKSSKAESGAVVKKRVGNPNAGNAMILAKKIRKDGEKWTDAVKRANAMIKNK